MSKSITSAKSAEKEIVLNTLLDAADTIQGRNAVRIFIQEVLTESEQYTIGRRILIARMLLAGHTQPYINEKLKVSPNTFGRIRAWAEQKLPGYNKAITQAKKKEREYKRSRLHNTLKKKGSSHGYRDPLAFSTLRSKYPAHFLLFNLAESVLEKIKNKNC